MAEDFRESHAIETYKSLIQISVEFMKLLLILNGGAAVALLAYLGKVSGKPPPDMRVPMGCYLAGLVICALVFFTSYFTQLRLYNESMGREASFRHTRLLWAAVILSLLSLCAFALGSYSAVMRFQ